jgi:hypothetical protein
MHVRDEDRKKLDCMRRMGSAGAPFAVADMARMLDAPATRRRSEGFSASDADGSGTQRVGLGGASVLNLAERNDAGVSQNRLASAFGEIKRHGPQLLWRSARPDSAGGREGSAWRMLFGGGVAPSSSMRALPAFGMIPRHR